ncbi:hypothetical protein BC829DRAFT_390367 [Chytridium lagenaria]|nr:hypothetical protein BC829DRAFT_390367 [Chytridium lagenaria]
MWEDFVAAFTGAALTDAVLTATYISARNSLVLVRAKEMGVGVEQKWIIRSTTLQPLLLLPAGLKLVYVYFR